MNATSVTIAVCWAALLGLVLIQINSLQSQINDMRNIMICDGVLMKDTPYCDAWRESKGLSKR